MCPKLTILPPPPPTGIVHLFPGVAFQFAVKMGYRTVAVARGTGKEALARQLGAHHYIDSVTQNVAAELTRLGGARVILANLTDATSMGDAIGGLDVDDRLQVIGASM